MSTDNLDSADLKGALSAPGVIREDVMDKIWDISKIPLPFTDMVGKDSHEGNEYTEWTEEALAAPNVKNRVIDGSDATGNDTELNVRVGNHSAIASKVVRVSYRAQASNSIGNVAKLGRQVSRRQQELRRDVEVQAMAQYASLGDTGSAAGVVGGLPTWLKTSTVNVTSPVGFNTTTKVTTLPTIATDGYNLTEADIRDLVESIFTEGGDPTVLMTIPGIIRKISEYLFTSSARVAALMSDQGKSREAAAALGSVNIFVTDFGTLRLVANRLQAKYDVTTGAAVYSNTASENNRADVFVLDPQYLKLSYLHGYRTDPLAKTGLADNRQMAVDWSLKVLNEKAQGFAAGVDPALDVIPG